MSGIADLKGRIQSRIRSALAVKVDAQIVAPDTFEKPGAKKLSLVVREWPDLTLES